MSARSFDRRILVGACCVAMAALTGSALAAGTNNTGQPNSAANAGAGKPQATTTAKATKNDERDAQNQVDQAAKVVKTMERDPNAAKLLLHARGVFVITHYGRAALGIGGRGGEGVMMVNRSGTWSDPAFYDIGGASIGAEAGGEGGSMVFVLNTQKAVDTFKQNNNWSFNAEAGLTIVNWSGKAQGSAGKGDVTVWSNTKGLLGSLAVSVTDITYDRGETSAFYGKPMKVADVFGTNAEPKGNVAPLRDALAGATASAATSNAGEASGRTAKSSASANASNDSNAQRND